MLDLPSLVHSARSELGLPVSAPREIAPPVAAATMQRSLLDSRVSLPAATSPTVEGVRSIARFAPSSPQLPATTSPIEPRFDAIHRTVEELGGRYRPALSALADIANGSRAVLGNEQLRGAQQAASHQLGTMFADAIEHGERTMPRPPRVDGNKVDLLVRNEQYLPRLYEDLDSAQRSITINQFNWEPDGSGARVARVLREKAAAGLDVRVMIDGYGVNERGKDVANELQRSLEAAGVRFVRTGGFRPGGSGFEHRKLITIDDHVAYTGGLGFGEKYDTWTDLMLRIEGPAAAAAAGSQLGTFRELAGAADDALRERAGRIGSALRDAASGVRQLAAGSPRSGALADASAAVTLLDNRPGVDLASTEAFLRDVASATKRLWATSTYLTTDVAKQALVDAARRGVDVKLLTTGPEAGNDAHQIHLGRTMFGELIDAGVELYEYPSILHAKSWLKDDDVAAVGSMNLSKSSMARAREITARVEDTNFAREYARFHEQARAGARLVQRSELDSPKLKALGVLTKLGLQF